MTSSINPTVLQHIIDNLPSGVTLFDAEQRMVASNLQLRRLLDFPDELFKPSLPTLYDLALFNASRGEYGPGDPRELARAICDRARQQQAHVFERQRPDGTVIEVRGTPLPTGEFISVYTDITDRKRTEREAQLLASRLDAVLNTLPQGVTVVDENLVIQVWNRSFEELLDLPPELMKPGVTFEEVVRFKAKRGEYGEVDIETKVRESTELARRFAPHRFVRQRPNGSSLEIQGQAMEHDGKIRGFVTTYTDVTELRDAHHTLEQLNAELDQRVTTRTQELQNLNRELESFTYSVSHDLRTPLRSIQGFASVLSEGEAERLTDDGRNALQRIVSNAGMMGKLISDLLAMSQHTRAELSVQPVNISEMARSLTIDLQSLDNARRIDWRIEDGLWLEADPTLIRVVLQNLLGNAWKYTCRNEQAFVEVFCSGRDEAATHVSVRDNGAGFDMRYAEQLFQPFRRLHKPQEFDGTGIGLATVQRILQRHGGQITGTGEVGKGATFRFSLPNLKKSPSAL